MYVNMNLSKLQRMIFIIYIIFIYLIYIVDVPDKPGMPDVSDITDTSVHLNWSAPKSDGGSPITSYTVEYMKKKDHKWTAVKTESPDTQYTVRGLKTEESYMFRVLATNLVCVKHRYFRQR